MRAREEIARSAAERLDLAPCVPALVGFDGFIDSIYHIVDQRRDMSPEGYERLKTITAFAARAASAAGKSANIEMVLKETRAGGNGPLISSGLHGLGSRVTYIGAVGIRGASSQGSAMASGTDASRDAWSIHPIYGDFARCCERVVPIGRPGTTDALEFDDGKLMLNHSEAVQEITWERLSSVVGLSALIEYFRASRLIGLTTWSLMGGVSGVWQGLMERVLPVIRGDGEARRVFVDLADPTRRPDTDLRDVLALLRRMDSLLSGGVTLGLNLSEAERVAGVMGCMRSIAYDPVSGARELAAFGEQVRALAVELRERIGVSCVVVHPREGAAAARRDGGLASSAWVEGPFVREPKLSTGAGDHFNAGFAFGQSAEMGLEECLALGVATSGAYVRDGGSAPRERIIELLRTMPRAE